MIPYTLVLEPGLRVYRIYEGYWFFGRPTVEELRHDLRDVLRRCRPDWNITDPEHGLRGPAETSSDFTRTGRRRRRSLPMNSLEVGRLSGRIVGPPSHRARHRPRAAPANVCRPGNSSGVGLVSRHRYQRPMDGGA